MNTKLLFENWRKFLNEAIPTNLSGLPKEVGLFTGINNQKKIYALYNAHEAKEELQKIINYGEELPFLSQIIGKYLLAALQTKPSVEGGSPFGAKQVDFVISKQPGYGRILYSIVSSEQILMSDREGKVSGQAQKVWKDFFDSSEEVKIDSNTGDPIGQVPSKIIKVKIDNYQDPKTNTKKDDGKIFAGQQNEPLNYVYSNNIVSDAEINSLKKTNQDFVQFLYQNYNNLNTQDLTDTFSSQGAQAFGSKYDTISDKERKVQEARKLGKPSSETNLGDWFKRKGAPGKKGGWVDCNTCRDGKCKPCGRQEGEKRSKYPRCRPTPSQCKGYKRRGSNLQKESND